jgi:CBS domain-containing protein
MKVSNFMTQQVITISRAAPVAAAIDLMRTEQVHALVIEPIHRRDAYGILTASDIASKVVATGRNARLIRVYEIMTKPCVVLNPDLAVEYAARLLTQLGIHSAPVIQGELLGIITLTDLLEPSAFAIDELEQPLVVELEKEIEELTEKANYVCSHHGATSQECADAWSRVDSIQAELAFYRTESLEKTAFESFQEDYPEAFKGQEYANWCSG